MKQKLYKPEELGFFPLYACTAEEHHSQEPVDHPEGTWIHQLFLVADGVGILNINNENYILNPGDMFYIGKDVPHQYHATEGHFYTSYMSFIGKGFSSIKSYYDLGNYGVYQNKSSRRFQQSLGTIVEHLEITHEISTLCSMTFSAVIDFFDETCKKEYTPMERVYQYLESNYSKALTLEDIADVYPFSKSKLCHDFKTEYGMTIFDALTRIRLENAAYMLKNNPLLKSTYVATACGFHDASYFCKMYKRFYGYSPKKR